MNNIQTQILSKSRREYWIYGRHSVSAAVQNPKRRIHKVLCTKQNENWVMNMKLKCIVSVVQESDIHNILKNNKVTHQGIIAYTEYLTQPNIDEFLKYTSKEEECFVIMLDQITDPYNIGAIIRTASAFNVNTVITTKHESPKENSTIVKVACGGFEEVPFIQVTNLSQTINLLKKNGFWIFGLDIRATEELQLYQRVKYNKVVFILGSEECGIRDLVKKSCDLLLKIPISERSNIRSINVSAAGAIAMYSYFCK